MVKGDKLPIDQVPIGSIVIAEIDGRLLTVACMRRFWSGGTGVLRVNPEDHTVISQGRNARKGSVYVEGDVLVEVVSVPGQPSSAPVELDPLLVGNDGDIFKKETKVIDGENSD